MSSQPREALSALIAAFERHLEASLRDGGGEDPVVVSAYEALADAFETYEDTLLEATGELTPLEVADFDDDGLDEDDDDDSEGVGEELYDEDDDDDEPSHYAGLDDEVYVRESRDS